MWEKLKAWLTSDEIFYTVVILLVGVGSYGLGRASVAQPAATAPVSGVRIEQAAALPVALEEAGAKTVVASRSGTKYHLLECPGAKQISVANKIEFASPAAARAAGYEPAANCPGL